VVRLVTGSQLVAQHVSPLAPLVCVQLVGAGVRGHASGPARGGAGAARRRHVQCAPRAVLRRPRRSNAAVAVSAPSFMPALTARAGPCGLSAARGSSPTCAMLRRSCLAYRRVMRRSTAARCRPSCASTSGGAARRAHLIQTRRTSRFDAGDGGPAALGQADLRPSAPRREPVFAPERLGSHRIPARPDARAHHGRPRQQTAATILDRDQRALGALWQARLHRTAAEMPDCQSAWKLGSDSLLMELER